jgi:hypothetical protein
VHPRFQYSITSAVYPEMNRQLISGCRDLISSARLRPLISGMTTSVISKLILPEYSLARSKASLGLPAQQRGIQKVSPPSVTEYGHCGSEQSPPGVMFFVELLHSGHSIENNIRSLGKPKSVSYDFIAYKIKIGVKAHSLGFLVRIFLQLL